MQDRSYAEGLNQMLIDASYGWPAVDVLMDRPDLHSAMVSHLALALGGAEIDFITVEVDEDEPYVDVLTFAGARVVWVRAKGKGERAVPATRIFSAGEIESLEITNVPNLVQQEFGAAKRISVIISIDGTKFDLPGDERATGKNHEGLATFLPGLIGRFAPVK